MIYRTTSYDLYNSRINLILSKLRTFERKKLSGGILENCAQKFYIPFRRRRREGCRDLFVTRIVETYKYVYKELEFFSTIFGWRIYQFVWNICKLESKSERIIKLRFYAKVFLYTEISSLFIYRNNSVIGQ